MGWAIWWLTLNFERTKKMDEYVNLAKHTIEQYVNYGTVFEIPDSLPQAFYRLKRGVFVTIRAAGHLRGCVGTVLPTKSNLAQEIVDNALVACSRDPRFYPVAKEELINLHLEVNVLSIPKPIKNLKNHNPKKMGLIVKAKDGRTGLLLPGLENVDTTGKQLAIACRKGEIDPERDDYDLLAFEVEKHSLKDYG